MKLDYKLLPILLWVLALFMGVPAIKGQTPVQARFSAGYTYNQNDFILGQEQARNTYGMVLQAGATFNIPVYRKYAVQTGLSGELIYARGEVGVSSYNSRTVKFYAPLLMTRPVSENTSLMAGVAMKNNKKMKLFHISGSYNFRYDLVFQMEHSLGNQWLLFATLNHNWVLPSAYFMNDPQTGILFGISYRLFSSGDATSIDPSETP